MVLVARHGSRNNSERAQLCLLHTVRGEIAEAGFGAHTLHGANGPSPYRLCQDGSHSRPQRKT